MKKLFFLTILFTVIGGSLHAMQSRTLDPKEQKAIEILAKLSTSQGSKKTMPTITFCLSCGRRVQHITLHDCPEKIPAQQAPNSNARQPSFTRKK